MENTICNEMFTDKYNSVSSSEVRDLSNAELNTEYVIKGIQTNDSEMEEFLFTLGCYEGEIVTVISELSDNYVIAIKDARYSVDSELAKAILI